jgi:hypothetical protein
MQLLSTAINFIEARPISLGARAPSPAMSAQREQLFGQKSSTPDGVFAGEGARAPSITLMPFAASISDVCLRCL